MLCLSLTRALNMAIFYEVYLYLSPLTVSLLTGLPYLFLSWSAQAETRCDALRCHGPPVCLLNDAAPLTATDD